MKKILLSALAFASFTLASAQEIGGYTAVTSEGTYTALDGATVVNTGIPAGELSGRAILSDVNEACNTVVTGKGFAIGFDFPFNGKTMKYFGIGTKGMLKLSETEDITMKTPNSWGSPYQIDEADGGNDIVFAYDSYTVSYTAGAVEGMDTTTISYKTEGDELVVEYKNMGINTSSWDTELVGTYNVQIRLKKDGTISFVYSGLANVPEETCKYYLGLRGNDGEYVMWKDGLAATNRSFGGYGSAYLSPVADGYTVTLNTPGEVVAPTEQPTELTYTVNYYSDRVMANASYTECVADKYLMVISEGAPAALPVDGTEYAKGDSIENAYVMAAGKAGSGYSCNLNHNAEYTITVYAYNSYGKGGVKYNTVDPLQTTFATACEKPAKLELVSTTKDEMDFTVEANDKNNLIYVVYNDKTWNPGNYGPRAFTGTPDASLKAGDDLYAEVVTLNRDTWENDTTYEKAGKVAYFGEAGSFKMENLQNSHSYYFIAYSYDPESQQFSQGADTLQIWASTNIVAPYKLDLTDAPEGHALGGWETNPCDYNEGFIADDADYPDVTSQTEGGRAYVCSNRDTDVTYTIKTPVIELTEDILAFDWHIHTKSGWGWFASPAPYEEWNEKDLLQFVLYVDGEEVELQKYDYSNAPVDETEADWHHESFDLKEYANKNVKFGIKWLCGNTNTTYLGFENLTVDETSVVNGISTVSTANAASSAVYNLAGQRVSGAQKGIMIQNGKKYLK